MFEIETKELKIGVYAEEPDALNIALFGMTAKECGWNTCQAFGYELNKIKDCVKKFLSK